MTRLPAGFLDRPVAHRAFHGPGRPENGISAIRASVSAGFGIEIDVQPSADGRAMVFHDETLERMTDATGPIRSRDADALSELRLLGTGEGVPTLADALQVVGGWVPLIIEIKDQSGMLGPTDGMLEAAVARDLETYSGPVAVMSFNPHSVARMRELAPDTPRGLTTEAFDGEQLPPETQQALSDMTMLDETEACFISHDVRDLDNPAVAAVRTRGLPILCWTVRSQKVADTALRIADQITFEGFTPA